MVDFLSEASLWWISPKCKNQTNEDSSFLKVITLLHVMKSFTSHFTLIDTDNFKKKKKKDIMQHFGLICWRRSFVWRFKKMCLTTVTSPYASKLETLGLQNFFFWRGGGCNKLAAITKKDRTGKCVTAAAGTVCVCVFLWEWTVA